MDELDYARMMAATLRNQPRRPTVDPMAGSVMSRPSEPPPELNADLPLEPVNPEDYVPNPKSLVAALKGAPALVGAVFPWMSKQNLQRLLSENAYTSGEKTKAGIAMLKPTDFLRATVPNEHGMATIANRVGRFDPYMMQNESQHPFLQLTGSSVKGHEGRHRTGGLLASTEGDEKLLPYVIRKGYEGVSPQEIKDMGGRKYKGQTWSGIYGRGDDVRVGEVTPLTYEEDLSKFVTNVDVPLTSIGVALKPQGALATAENLRMYRQPIPFGKIPPPKPRTGK